MKRLSNIAIITGYVGKDPEVKYMDNGTGIANFSVATSDDYKNKQGEKIEETEWHRIVIFGKLAEIVEKYVKKGSFLQLMGKIKTRSWDDKDGNKRYTTEIICDNMQMLGSKSDTGLPDQADIPNDDFLN